MTKHKTKEERRRQILDAAVNCFAEKGYYKATMDDVVREASLSKGALYWYFKDKRDLFQCLVEIWFTEILAQLSEVFASEGSAASKLHRIVEAIKHHALARPELVRALLEYYTLAVRDPELRKWLKENYRDDMLVLQALVEEGVASGEFRNVNAGAVARMIMAYLDGALLHEELFESSEGSASVLEEVADTVVSLLIKEEGAYERAD